MRFSKVFALSLEQALILKVLGDDSNSLFHAGLLRVDVNLWVLWSLVWSADTGELLDLACSGLLVQALWISLLGLFHGDVDEDLDEWERGVGVGGVGVEFSCEVAVGFVGGDEGGEGEGGGIGEELGDLEKR